MPNTLSTNAQDIRGSEVISKRTTNIHYGLRLTQSQPVFYSHTFLKPQNEVSRKLPEGIAIKETAMLKAIFADTGISITQLGAITGHTTGIIDSMINL